MKYIFQSPVNRSCDLGEEPSHIGEEPSNNGYVVYGKGKSTPYIYQVCQ